MADLVVTVPKQMWFDWIDEGDAVGETLSGEEWGYFLGGSRPPIEAGDRLYIVAWGLLRGYSPVTKLAAPLPGQWAICRRGGAVGADVRKWRFRCVACGNVQSNELVELRNAELAATPAASHWVYFECEGRHTHGVGCDWSLGGLFQIHRLVVTADGREHSVFEFADDDVGDWKPFNQPGARGDGGRPLAVARLPQGDA